MPIRIDYSPVGSLMNLARSAGEAHGAQQSAAQDLAFTQMALQAQVQNAQIGASIQRNDQAFQLQQAALQRQSRTPTRATSGTTPLSQDVDRVLGRMTTTREWGQQDQAAQLTQLEQMRGSGQYSEREIESIKLGIMSGQSLGTLLKERVEKPPKPLISVEQRVRQWRQGWDQQLDPVQKRIDLIVKEQMVQYNIHDEDGDIIPALQKQAEKRQGDLRRKLVALRKHQSNLQTQQQQEWADVLQGPQEGVRTPDSRETSQPAPANPKDRVRGQVYEGANGQLGRWNGENWELLE